MGKLIVLVKRANCEVGVPQSRPPGGRQMLSLESGVLGPAGLQASSASRAVSSDTEAKMKTFQASGVGR